MQLPLHPAEINSASHYLNPEVSDSINISLNAVAMTYSPERVHNEVSSHSNVGHFLLI